LVPLVPLVTTARQARPAALDKMHLQAHEAPLDPLDHLVNLDKTVVPVNLENSQSAHHQFLESLAPLVTLDPKDPQVPLEQLVNPVPLDPKDLKVLLALLANQEETEIMDLQDLLVLQDRTVNAESARNTAPWTEASSSKMALVDKSQQLRSEHSHHINSELQSLYDPKPFIILLITLSATVLVYPVVRTSLLYLFCSVRRGMTEDQRAGSFFASTTILLLTREAPLLPANPKGVHHNTLFLVLAVNHFDSLRIFFLFFSYK